MVTASGIVYTHQKLGEDNFGLAGFYTPQKEVRLALDGREVLYVVGRAVVESSCCGSGAWSYVLVPGYVIEWHVRKNEAGLPVSTIDVISNSETKSRITRLIREREGIDCITFW
jgi:hypothetical protein